MMFSKRMVLEVRFSQKPFLRFHQKTYFMQFHVQTRLVRVVPSGENDAGLGVCDVVLQRLFGVGLAERDRGYGQRAGPDAQQGRGEGRAVGGEDAHAVAGAQFNRNILALVVA